MAGATDRALDILDLAVEQGFYPLPYIAVHCPFLVPLRGTSRFAEIKGKAERQTEAFAQETGR